MNRFEWIPSLAINVEPVDSQHQRLFEIYNSACASEEDSFDQIELVKELFRYSQVHFREEESLMAKVGYPAEELDRHKQLHRAFIRRLDHFQGTRSWELLNFFREWLLRHILAVDSKVGRFMREHRVEA